MPRYVLMELSEKTTNGVACVLGDLTDRLVLDARRVFEEMRPKKKDQDGFAIESYRRAKKAVTKGWFAPEIAPYLGLDSDEEPFQLTSPKTELAEFPTVFKPEGGTITAGNASKIKDAGCAMVLASGEEVEARGWKPMARVVGFADAEVEPVDFFKRWSTDA